MSLLDDLKTLLAAFAVGAALTLSINYVVVNYAEGPRPAKAAAQPAPAQPSGTYKYDTPGQAPKYDGGSGYGGSY
jgi:hypothetical protein